MKSKSIKNIVYGLLGQIVTIAIGLLIPRLILLNYGSETNGLTSSIAQIFAYVALLEAGVGGATLQALYKPIGNKDRTSVSAIMAATHYYYTRTGILYSLAVVVLAFVYPIVVQSDLSYWVVFGVIIFNGMGGAINYLFQGKYHLLLQADGRGYIKANLSTIVYVCSSVIKIIMVMLGCSIVVVQAAYFMLNLAQMVYVGIYIKKHYLWLDLRKKADFEAISQKNSVMVHQLSALVFGNTDSIILTFFGGLKAVSVYALANLFIGQINNLINHVSSGILFALGQSFSTNKDKFNRLFTAFEVLYYAMASFCLFMIFVFLNPFLALYTSGVTDIQYVNKYLPPLFVVSQFLTWARVPVVYVINNCAGHYKQTQFQSILESAINLLVSLALVKKMGIYGVLIGTIVALLYRTNEMIIYADKKILKRGLPKAYSCLGVNTLWTVICCIIGAVCLPAIDSYLSLFLWACVYGLIMIVGLLGINYLFNKEGLLSVLQLVLGGRIHTGKNRIDKR